MLEALKADVFRANQRLVSSGLVVLTWGNASGFDQYDFGPLKSKDFVDISTENDSFYCHITTPGMITKLGFATEELYLRSQKK